MILVAAMLIMAFTPTIGLRRFEVVNKSGDTLKWRLERADDLEGIDWYYQEVPEGSRKFPVSRMYTVQRGYYYLTIQFYELEYEDEYGKVLLQPNYKLVCELNYDQIYVEPYIDLTRNQKVTVLPCESNEPQSLGEPGMAKFWYPAYIVDSDTSPLPNFYVPWEYQIDYRND
jgi:hypothetical protein